MYTRNFLVQCADTPASIKAPPGLDEVIKELRGLKVKQPKKYRLFKVSEIHEGKDLSCFWEMLFKQIDKVSKTPAN